MMVMDLFSGIGGFSLGLERAGMQTAAFCEIEPYARRVLAKHWPEVPIYEDIRTVTAAGLAADGIAADVICGGFPCQDLSLAGAGAGLSGGRSGLWFEYLRLIGEVRPQFAIIENVSALRSRGLDTVLRGLAEIGYDAEWHCIPASAVGAPHRRDRIWIVAYPGRLSGSTGREAGYVAGSQGACEADCEQRQRNGNAADDSGSDVAHPVSERREWWEGYPQRRISNRPAAGRSEDTDGSFAEGEGCGAGHVANSDRAGLAQWESERGYPCPQLTSVERADWWLVEPDVGRVANGVPARVDRLRCLGNAIVPQIAEMIGRDIMGRAA